MTTVDQATEASQIAFVIKRQIGLMGLATVGASDFGFTYSPTVRGGLAFKARLHVDGGSRARVCRIEISLNGADEYDIDVHIPGRRKFDAPTTTRVVSGAHASDLARVMVDLDSNGVTR